MKSYPYTITPVALHEIELLRTLAITTFRDTYQAFNTPENMDSYVATHFSKERLAGELSNTDVQYFFLRSEGTIAGYIKLNEGDAQTESRFPNTLEIERIYAASKFHGMGLGRALLQKAVEVGKEKNLDFIWLGVWDQNTKAIAFYERNGFYKDGIHPFMLGDAPQRDYVMKYDLQ